MLTNAPKTLVNNLFKKNYEKIIINILITIFIFYKNYVKIFLKLMVKYYLKVIH